MDTSRYWYETDGSQASTQTVGGFMTDARKTNNNTFQQDLKSNDKGSGKQKQKQKIESDANKKTSTTHDFKNKHATKNQRSWKHIR